MLAVIVVMVTVYALMVPAITMTTEDPDSGIYFSSDLADFTNGFEFLDRNGHPIEDDIIYVGENYKIMVHFSENNTLGNNSQFHGDDDGYLTYQFDTSRINVNPIDWTPLIDSSGEDPVEVGRIRISSNGLLTVDYYEVDNAGAPSPGIKFFEHYPNTSLNVGFDVCVDDTDVATVLNIDLGSNITISVEPKKEGGLNVSKEAGAFNERTHSISYTVRVECGYGKVTDITFDDVATIRDVDTNVTYDGDDNAFTYGNYSITDLDENPIYDEHNNRITDIDDLPDTLVAGEGYLIHYTITADPSIYVNKATYSLYESNAFTASGKDLDNNLVTSSDTANSRMVGNNFAKSGSFVGTTTVNGTEMFLMRWTVQCGDAENISNDPVTITDVLGESNQHYYLLSDHNPGWQIHLPTEAKDRGDLSWGSTARMTTSETTGIESATFTLPAGGSRYELVYYTVSPTSGEHSNIASTSHTGWTRGSTVWATQKGADIVKNVDGADDDYIYYSMDLYMPGTLYCDTTSDHDTHQVYIRDDLTGPETENNKQFLYENLPEDLQITATFIDTDETVEFVPYTGEGSTLYTYKLWHYYDCRYIGANKNQFRITFDNYNSSLSGKWPYTDDLILHVSYKTPKSSPDYAAGHTPQGQTIGDRLATSHYVRNYAVVSFDNWNTEETAINYNEMESFAKKGQVSNARDGIISYRVAFTNDTFEEGGALFKSDKVALLTDDFTGGYLHDVLDERCEYVDGSMYALIYQRPKDITKNLTEYYGENLVPAGVFKYTGNDIDNGEINAEWEDFTAFDFTGQFSPSNPGRGFTYYADRGKVNSNGKYFSNLEEFLQDLPDVYGVVFIYDVKVKDEYRQNLSDTAAVMTISNTAELGWEDEHQAFTFGPVGSFVDYNTDLITKENYHVSTDDKIKYVITVNPYGYDLTEQDYFTLEDTMCESLSLYLASILVEEGEIDPVSGDITWTEYEVTGGFYYSPETNTFKVTVPDDRPMRITYDCHITETGDVSLYNVVKIKGYNKAVNTNNAVFNVSASGGAGSEGSIDNLYVRKNNADTEESINGAVFALYGKNPLRYGDATAIDADETIEVNGDILHFYHTFTTADNPLNSYLNGTFTVDDLSYLEKAGHFAIKEITPPPDYFINDEIFDFYWEELPLTPIDGVPVYENGDTLVVDDEPAGTVALPETGGIGIIPFVSGGALLIMTACAYIIISARRKRRWEG